MRGPGRGARPVRDRVRDGRAGDRSSRMDPVAAAARERAARSTKGKDLPFSSRHLQGVLRDRRREVRLGEARSRRSGSMKRDGLDARLGDGRRAPGSPSASPATRPSSCATTAPRASRAPRRTSAPARTRCWRSSRARSSGCRSRRSRSCSATRAPAGSDLGRLDGDGVGRASRARGRADRRSTSLLATATERPSSSRANRRARATRAGASTPRTAPAAASPFADVLRTRQRPQRGRRAAAPRARSGARAEVLEPLVRRALRRGDLAAGDRAAPREPRGHGDRRRPDPEPARRRATRSRAPSSWASAWRFFEETAYDPRNGAPINASLADYIVAVNADVPKLEVHFLEYPDTEPERARRARRSARSASRAWRRRSRTRCTTRPASACASCRSRSSTSSASKRSPAARAASRRRAKSRMALAPPEPQPARSDPKASEVEGGARARSWSRT